ncbi:MAG: hypothetical protein GX958_11285 [Desulfitobacterium sp.]|nr:hypothetical protein [Desulfitobacterium sp.]
MDSSCAKKLSIPTFAENPNPEYLFFPGCEPFNPKSNWDLNISCTQMLTDRGIDFAILGDDQWCCGDKACRLGFDTISTLLAQRNILAWNEMNIKKIITTCPRCYYNFDDKYRRYGGNFEVILFSKGSWEL